MLIYIQTADESETQSLLKQIYLDYRDKMMAAAYAILQDRFDAEDAVHQAFVYIAENLDKFSHGDDRRTVSYIVKLTESRAIDILRRKQRKLVALEEIQLGKAQQYPGLSELAYTMSQLPVRYRNVLILRYAYGYEFKEIAECMNLSEVNARRMVSRAKEKLESICRKEGIL